MGPNLSSLVMVFLQRKRTHWGSKRVRAKIHATIFNSHVAIVYEQKHWTESDQNQDEYNIHIHAGNPYKTTTQHKF